MKIRSRTGTWLTGLLLSAISFQARAEATHPVVLELFTSQGCSSCPPADKLLGGLADQPGLLALSYHITYWNNLGWADPLSFDAATARQNGYAGAMGASQVYTPQLVVQGTKDVMGADEGAVTRAATDSASEGLWIPVSVTVENGKLRILGAAKAPIDAELLLVGYLRHSKNKVERGENAGTVAEHRNSVVSIQSLGKWNGSAIDRAEDLPQGDGYAVLVQSGQYGPIIGGGWSAAR
jgi:hypothetical protein